jgi:hypothetical protein
MPGSFIYWPDEAAAAAETTVVLKAVPDTLAAESDVAAVNKPVVAATTSQATGDAIMLSCSFRNALGLLL